MTDKNREISVGIVVSIAAIIVILSIIWGRRLEIFSNRISITVRFEDVRGLEEGDPVLIRGVERGRVAKIELKPHWAEVQLWIRKPVVLKSDMIVILENKEIMGGKQISIYPGDNDEPAVLDSIITGRLQGDLGTILSRVEHTLYMADSTLMSMRKIFDRARIENILNNIEMTTGEARLILSENRERVNAALFRLEKMTRRLEQDSTAMRIGSVVADLNSMILLIRDIAVKMEQEQGTFGKLISDRWLYDQLLKTTTELDSLIRDIRANPKKYIHFSIF